MLITRDCKYVLLAVLGGLLAACTHAPAPDLARLYETGPLPRTAGSDVTQPPVILVHGIFGARLRSLCHYRPGRGPGFLRRNYPYAGGCRWLHKGRGRHACERRATPLLRVFL
jgi:hypothetical protein